MKLHAVLEADYDIPTAALDPAFRRISISSLRVHDETGLCQNKATHDIVSRLKLRRYVLAQLVDEHGGR